MNRRAFVALVGAAVLSATGVALAAGAVAPYIAAAVADPGRPKADTDRDADRKPAAMLAFAGVKRGTVMAELIPAGGYFTRIFSKAVGPKGKVFAIMPPVTDPAAKPAGVVAIAADPAYANVQLINEPFNALTTPQPVDLVWTSQNYHDLHLKRFNLDVVAVNKSVFAALKPGGLYVIVDHSALPGEPVDAADRYHRIDPAIVRREVEAAGFKFESELDVLHNPADPKNILVFDP